MLILISSMGGFSGPECKVAPFKMWVAVEMSYYIFNCIYLYIHFQFLKRNRRENLKFVLFNGFLCVVHSGWLIYGNVLYYPNSQACAE